MAIMQLWAVSAAGQGVWTVEVWTRVQTMLILWSCSASHFFPPELCLSNANGNQSSPQQKWHPLTDQSQLNPLPPIFLSDYKVTLISPKGPNNTFQKIQMFPFGIGDVSIVRFPNPLASGCFRGLPLRNLNAYSFYIYQYNQKIFVIVFPNVPQVLISKMSKIFPLGGQPQLKVEKALETNYHSTAAAKCPLTWHLIAETAINFSWLSIAFPMSV